MNLFYNKDYFNLTKIFILMLDKMVVNKTECYRLEQREAEKKNYIE